MSKFYLLILVFTVQSYICVSQTPELLLQKVKQDYTSEKIFIHYDKSSYVSGETVWFKAYLMEGFLPATGSTILSVELLNDTGKIIQKIVLPVTASMASGSFTLPKDIPQGSYTVRAFTRLMMNFGAERFYTQVLNIYNPSTTQKNETAPSKSNVYFLPEGGNLIAKIKNTIAFKSADDKGFPLSVIGTINDGAGKEIATFKSVYDGMGKFEFVPNPGEKYVAKCLINGVENKSVPLPEVQYNGLTLGIKYSNNKTYIEIDGSKAIDENQAAAYVLGVEESLVAFKLPIINGQKLTRAALPIETLPSGILQITVFNKNDKPLAERLLFVNSGDYAVANNFNIETKDIAARKKNEFSVELQDTATGTFSVSVINADDEVPGFEKVDNIVSRFLLTDNLKGRINNPSYYFESTDEVHKQHLDLVMLTNGWRRYSWNEIIANRFPAMVFKDLDYITLAGTAYKPNSKTALSNASLTVMVNTKDTIPDFLDIKTDKEGKFTLSRMLFEDTANFQFKNSTGKNDRIGLVLPQSNLKNNFFVSQKSDPLFVFKIPTEIQKKKINQIFAQKTSEKGFGILLDEVKIQATRDAKAKQFEKKYVSGRFSSGNDKTIDLITDPPKNQGIRIFDFLRSQVAGVNVIGGPTDYVINYRQTRSISEGLIPMNIFLDEVQVAPGDLAVLRVADIALIKVYGNGALAGAGGALAIYTKKGADYNPLVYNVFSSVKIEGFSPTKEFFSPNYDLPADNEIVKDERSTLYWNPFLHTDSINKKMTFSFFNSDNAKRFKLVMQGMTTTGQMLYVEKIIE